jgi:hypothetical protein
MDQPTSQSLHAALHCFGPSSDHWLCNHVPNGISLKTRLKQESEVTDS